MRVAGRAVHLVPTAASRRDEDVTYPAVRVSTVVSVGDCTYAKTPLRAWDSTVDLEGHPTYNGRVASDLREPIRNGACRSPRAYAANVGARSG
jgi:hypothetical protein